MKNKILISLGVLLLILIIGCGGALGNPFNSMVLAETQYNTSPSNIMIVFYDKTEPSGRLYLFWCDMAAEIIDNGDGTWDVVSPQVKATGVNQGIVDYGYYQYKEIEIEYDDEGKLLPVYMDDLNLQSPVADDLPKSEHIGKLVDVNPSLAKPATVRRRWMGVNYDVKCLVTQSVVAMWPDELSVGDYVLVSFIEEIPDTEEVHIAIVTDKIFVSWQ